jgi:DNA-binding NarL/FixJ family response regulator
LLRLLASGAIDGYHAIRHFLRVDGTEVMATIWVRLEKVDEKMIALVTIRPGEGASSFPLISTDIKMVLVVTDHDWVIEHVSTDIKEILGVSPEPYEGSALLALLQPGDVQNFVLAVARVDSGGGAATLKMHVRGNDRWLRVSCLVVAMCRHSPPRLGLSLATDAQLGVGVTAEGRRGVAVRAIDGLGGMSDFRRHVPLECLSSRQWEILTGLARGEPVQVIADGLYLSPSTVRNHLTAIYRKFGVHSQAGLLAELLRATDPL